MSQEEMIKDAECPICGTTRGNAASKVEPDYDGDDYCLLCALDDILKLHPENELIKSAHDYVSAFMDKGVSEEFRGCGISFVYRYNDEMTHVDFELSEERLAIETGGVAYSDCGSDCYGDEVWSLEAGDHAESWCDIVDQVIEIMNLGGEVKLIDPDDEDD